MRATSWTGSEAARRQEPVEPAAPLQYAIPAGIAVEIQKQAFGSGHNWRPYTTREPFAAVLEFRERTTLYFRHMGYRVRVKERFVQHIAAPNAAKP